MIAMRPVHHGSAPVLLLAGGVLARIVRRIFLRFRRRDRRSSIPVRVRRCGLGIRLGLGFAGIGAGRRGQASRFGVRVILLLLAVRAGTVRAGLGRRVILLLPRRLCGRIVSRLRAITIWILAVWILTIVRPVAVRLILAPLVWTWIRLLRRIGPVRERIDQ